MSDVIGVFLYFSFIFLCSYDDILPFSSVKYVFSTALIELRVNDVCFNSVVHIVFVDVMNQGDNYSMEIGVVLEELLIHCFR